jgi:DNA invertase Pin-like site-specific DNA recombinase
VRYYTEKISKNPEWELVQVYADPAVSGTSRRNRLQFDQMIYDCIHGKIDIIITKSMSRFARNQLDSLAVIKLLKGLKPPVTVLFEDDHIDSSDLSMEVVMTFFSMLAEQESSRKSSSVIWGFERRKEAGFYLVPTHNLLGYDKTEAIHKDDREIFIVEDEANIVRLIFFMFLAGFRVSEIAHTLTEAGVATSKGNTTWNSSSVLGILKNERYAGDVQTNKTFHDFAAHHTYKNRGERASIYEEDHHPAIVSHEVYSMTQRLLASHKYGYDPYVNGTYALSVISTGLLQGFVPINIHWAGSSLQEYIDIAGTEDQTADLLQTGLELLCYPGCEVVRPQDLSHNKKASLRMTPTSFCLGTSCVSLIRSDYIELLFDPIDKLLAIRPSESQMPGAIRWKKQKEGKQTPCTVGSAAFTRLVYELMEWPQLWNVSLLAQTYTAGNNTVLIFDLTQYEINALPYAIPKKKKNRINNDIYYDIELMIAQQIELLHQKQVDELQIEETIEEPEEELPRPKRERLHPREWMESFGQPSQVAAIQGRRYQAESLENLELDAEATIPEQFDYRVEITEEMLQEKLAALHEHTHEEDQDEQRGH